MLCRLKKNRDYSEAPETNAGAPMQVSDSNTRLLRREEAAQYLREKHGLPIVKQELAKRAVYGGGPAFRKFGRHPLYSPADLDAFAKESLTPLVRSTAELAADRKGEARLG